MSEGRDKFPMVFEWQSVDLKDPGYRTSYEYLYM